MLPRLRRTGVGCVRTLPDALKAYLDARIPDVLNRQNPVEVLTQAALSCVGVHNEGGNDRGYVVELFQSVVGKPCAQAWCLDFVQAMIAYTEAVTGKASPLPATELCLGLWNSAKAYSAVTPARAGDIVLWRFGSTIEGHCGIILGSDSLRYQTVEGNTSDSQEIDRLGDGVWRKQRARGGSKTFVELGFLRPFP